MTTSTDTALSTDARRHPWVPWVAAVAGAAFLLKAVLIIASGDRIGDAPMAVLYLGGLFLGVVAAVGFGLRRERTAAKVAVAAGGVALLVMWIMGLGDLLTPLVALVSEAEHVQVEVPIGVAGAVLLAAGWLGFSRDTGR